MILDLRSATVSLLFAITGVALGQESSLQIRAVLNDPGKRPTFYLGNPGEGMTELNLAIEGLTEPQTVSISNGSLNLYSTNKVDKDNAKASLAATMKVPAGSKSLIVIIFPAAEQTPPYRMIAVPDDIATFPWGSNKVINLTPVEFALQLGELKLQLPGGKITDVPKLKNLGDANDAQTNFYYKQGDQWVVATERRLQYLDDLRRVFVIYKQPKALAPDVRTIQDQKLPVIEAQP
ncbi:MAG: hypothetical protein V4640_10590 [Verrucomicrobiota bacterium]